MKTIRTSAALIALLAGLSSARAQDKKDLVKPSLLADTSAVVAGKPFTVGVLMKLAPRWHVYWINPGESGQAPEVEWKLPEGYTASELKFPTPHKYTLPGGILAYGYNSEVLLTATITPPASAAGADATIVANVHWLVCETVCIPGSATLDLKLPVSTSGSAANTDIFTKWAPEFPFDKPPETKGIITSSRTSVLTKPAETFQIQSEVIFGKEYPGSAELFPPFSEEFDISPPEITQNKQKMIIKYTLKPLTGEKVKPGKYIALLAYTMASGERRGINLPFTIVEKNTDTDKPKP